MSARSCECAVLSLPSKGTRPSGDSNDRICCVLVHVLEGCLTWRVLLSWWRTADDATAGERHRRAALRARGHGAGCAAGGEQVQGAQGRVRTHLWRSHRLCIADSMPKPHGDVEAGTWSCSSIVFSTPCCLLLLLLLLLQLFLRLLLLEELPWWLRA